MGNGLIVKHNYLVHARYELPLPEQRLVCLLCMQLTKYDVDFKTYRITVDDFASMYGLRKDRLFGEIKDITLRLLDHKLHVKSLVHVPGKGERTKHEHFRWFSYASYIDGEGCIDIRFDPALKPYLLELKEKYTKYAAKYLAHLKKTYSARIYEMILSARKHESDKIIYAETTIEDIRESFNLTESEHKLPGHLIGNIIKPAINEINKHTDISVVLEPIKKIRKIVGLRFIATYKAQESLDLSTGSPNVTIIEDDQDAQGGAQAPLNPLAEELTLMGVTEGVALDIVGKYDQDVISRNIAYTKRKKTKDQAGYVITAIALDYGKAEHEAESKRKQKASEEAAKKKGEAEQTREKTKQTQEEIGRALEIFWTLPEDVQQGERQAYANTLYPAIRKTWDREPSNGKRPEEKPMFRGEFIKFLMDGRGNIQDFKILVDGK